MANTIEHEIETTPETKSGPSMVVTLAVCAGISLAAAAAGFGASAMFLKPATAAVAMAPAGASMDGQPAEGAGTGDGEPAAGHGAAAGGHGGAKAQETHASGEQTVVDLPPLMTNLANPRDTWIRMELSLVFDGDADSHMSEEIQQDILGYLRTTKLYNLEGGSGYQHLMEDLEERASIRSEGQVQRVLIRTLILE